MQTGWIKLHRKFRDNPYMRRPAYRAIWIELLLEAEHLAGKSALFKGERIILKPGQLTCGAKQLSLWTSVSRSSVSRILKCFENENQIEIQTSNRFSLITIKNWETYQTNEKQNENQMRTKWEADENPVSTPKEDKNLRIKELNNIYMSFKEKINNKSKLTNSAKNKIKVRLKTYSEDELLTAIANFSKDTWWMEHNAQRGVAWFFHTDDRIDQFLNIKPRPGTQGYETWKPDPEWGKEIY